MFVNILFNTQYITGMGILFYRKMILFYENIYVVVTIDKRLSHFPDVGNECFSLSDTSAILNEII